MEDGANTDTPDAPTANQQFSPIDTPADPAPQGTPEAQPSDQSQPGQQNAGEVVKEISVIEGQENNSLDLMRTLESERTGNQDRQPEAKPELSPEPPAAQKPHPEPDEKPKLIFGKYKTIEDAEKAHKKLERNFHEDSQTRKENTTLRSQLKYMEKEAVYAKRTDENLSLDAPDEITLNERIAENPAKAIRQETDRREMVQERKLYETNENWEQDRLKSEIKRNVDRLEVDYPEFTDNRQGFADWLEGLGADIDAICVDHPRLETTYGEFIAANRDPQALAQEQRDAGAAEALDKHEQIPPASQPGVPMPPLAERMRGQPEGNPRFTPLGGPDTPPPDMTRPSGPSQEMDPLDDMERHLGIGVPQNKFF